MAKIEGSCECGRKHRISIETIVIDESFWPKLLQYLKKCHFNRLLLVADFNTYEVLGNQVYTVLAEQRLNIDLYVFPTREHLVPDDEAVRIVQDEIRRTTAQCVLAVGSGVINDIVRYATFQEALSYISMPTAPSMDGYTSTVAALQLNGVKTTIPAHAPQAIFTAPSILCEAPWELIQSGYGDLVGKVISLMDWKLGRELYQEYFCPKAHELVLQHLQFIVQNTARIRDRDAEAIQALFAGLINSGIAIAMVGNSRPASGSEHHCSHVWDLLAFKGIRHFHSHGLQVGYATYWMMKFYRRFASLENLSEPVIPEIQKEWLDNIRDFYEDGKFAIEAAQREKLAWLRTRICNLPHDARDLVRQLEPEFSMLTDVENSLHVMGITDLGSFLELNTELLRLTFKRANEIRSRYTIFDFFEGQGLLDTVVDEILSES